jgi:hypothetical protein
MHLPARYGVFTNRLPGKPAFFSCGSGDPPRYFRFVMPAKAGIQKLNG